jgi:hypothetical protein
MIPVTGMHRSGTSFVSDLLSRLGLDFGDKSGFYNADQWNANGYFEQIEFIDLNHRIITMFKNTVGGIELLASYLVYMTMPSRKILDRRAKKNKLALIKLSSQYADKVVKDPRFCLTLPYWKEWGDVTSCVVCLRHPLEIAISLKKRQKVPLSLGLRFWDYHMKSLLQTIDHIPTLYLDFNHLAMGKNVETQLLSIRRFFKLNMHLELMHTLYLEAFEPALKHHTAPDGVTLPPCTKKLWGEFQQRYRNSLKRN